MVSEAAVLIEDGVDTCVTDASTVEVGRTGAMAVTAVVVVGNAELAKTVVVEDDVSVIVVIDVEIMLGIDVVVIIDVIIWVVDDWTIENIDVTVTMTLRTPVNVSHETRVYFPLPTTHIQLHCKHNQVYNSPHQAKKGKPCFR